MSWNRRKTIKKKVIEHKSISEHILEGFILLASFVISLSVAILSIAGKFDSFQTISTTMLSFLCAEYVGHSFLEKSKYFKAKKEYSLIEQVNDWSGKFFQMNEYCKMILENSHGPQDLFVITCKKSIDNLYYMLQIAARDEKIEINQDFIINSVGVFDALNVSSDKTVEITFPIDEIKDGVLQTPEDKKFFETAYKLVQDGIIQTIKVILILKDSSFLYDERLCALLKFYNLTDGFEGKYVSKVDFIKACESNLISKYQLDFGIYGPRMLFKVESYEPYKGTYTKNIEEVQRYHKLFDEIWNFESITHDLPNNNGKDEDTMSLSELFSLLATQKQK